MAKPHGTMQIEVKLAIGEQDPFVLGTIEIPIRFKLDVGESSVNISTDPHVVNDQVATLLAQTAARLRSPLAQSTE